VLKVTTESTGKQPPSEAEVSKGVGCYTIGKGGLGLTHDSLARREESRIQKMEKTDSLNGAENSSTRRSLLFQEFAGAKVFTFNGRKTAELMKIHAWGKIHTRQLLLRGNPPDVESCNNYLYKRRGRANNTGEENNKVGRDT